MRWHWAWSAASALPYAKSKGAVPGFSANAEEGAVLLDGRDIRTLCVKWMRSHMALVQQEPVLFSGSIFENITFGSESVLLLGMP